MYVSHDFPSLNHDNDNDNGEDIVPLISKRTQSQSQLATSSCSSSKRNGSKRKFGAVVVVVLAAGVFRYAYKHVLHEGKPFAFEAHSLPKHQYQEPESAATPQEVKKKHQPNNLKASPNALLSTKVKDAMEKFNVAEAEMIENLRKDYGEYFDTMFGIATPLADQDGDKGSLRRLEKFSNTGKEALGRNIITFANTSSSISPDSNKEDDMEPSTSTSPPTFGLESSWDRMKRKLVIKLLGAFLEQPDGTGTVPNKFVWATGGNSVGAGHGNLYRESYTRVMERTARGMFQAAGLALEGRNYGSSATRSAPETAACVASIFGTDEVDVLAYDFGLTDGRDSKKNSQAYFWKAATTMSPRNDIPPTCMGINLNKNTNEAFQDLHSLGLATGWLDSKWIEAVTNAAPDTLGMTEEEINALPVAVRSLRCGDQIESGDPYCKRDRFNITVCPDRLFRVSWHPGWKIHKITGTLLALFLGELIHEALEDIRTYAGSTAHPKETLATLMRSERADYRSFIRDTTITSVEEGGKRPKFVSQWKEEHKPKDVSLEALWANPSVCHTGRLPSQMRYKGILTGTKEPIASHLCDQTVKANDTNATSQMRLVCQNFVDFQPCEENNVSVLTSIDYKDKFYVHETEGWKTLRLPTDAEVKEYLAPETDLKGAIAFCNFCDRMCPQDQIDVETILAGGGEIKVNGAPVANFTALHTTRGVEKANCYMFQGEDGTHYFEPDTGGRFVIAARSKTEGMGMYFTSFIIW